MATEVATAYVSLVPSARGFTSKVESEIGGGLGNLADREGSKFGKTFADKAARNLDQFGRKATTFVSLPIIAGFGLAVKAASDLGEAVNKTDVVFGKSAQAIHDFSETSAKDLGISKRAAEQAAGTFGNLFVSMKIGQPAAADMSTSLVKLAADMASFNNASPEEALEALRAGLVGETEPLRRFGVNLNDAALREKAFSLGLVKTTKEVLPPAAKAQAAYALIVEQTATAQGDFARTSDGLANQQRILKAKLEDTAAEMGTKLLPAALALAEAAGALVDGFSALPDPMQNAVLVTAALAAVAGPVATIFGRTIVAARALGAAYEYLTIRASALTLASGGLTLLFAGIGVLAYGFSQVKQSFKDMAQAATNDMGKAVNQLALFSGTEKEVALNAYRAATGIQTMTEATTGLKGQEFGAELLNQSKAARQELEILASTSGVTKERIVQLADSLGINLAKATRDQREELTAAIAEVGRAVTPTERLEAVTETLGNTASTTAEQFGAFKEALDAALGVQLSADEAAIRYQERIAALSSAISSNGTTTGFATEKQRALTGALIEVVSAAGAEVTALVEAGKISADASVQKQELINRLDALKAKFPALTGKIDEYKAHLATIPDKAVTAIVVTGAEEAVRKFNLVKAGARAAARIVGFNVTASESENGGGRRLGGPVEPSSIYEVTEGGIPELLRQGNRTFLLPGAHGTVIPAADMAESFADMPGRGSEGGVPLENVLVIDGQVFARVMSVATHQYVGARS